MEIVPKQDNRKAEELLKKVDTVLDAARVAYDDLMSSYAQIGELLVQVKETKAWMIKFKSFNSYLKYAEGKFGRGKSSLYHYVTVAERLLPTISSQDLQKMGINKAQILATVKHGTGQLPKEFITKALGDGTVEELKEYVFETTNRPPDDRTKWFDVGGVYFTKEEREEYERAYSVAVRIDPPISKDLSDHMRTKEVLLRFAREFLATYEQEVEHGGI